MGTKKPIKAAILDLHNFNAKIQNVPHYGIETGQILFKGRSN